MTTASAAVVIIINLQFGLNVRSVCVCVPVSFTVEYILVDWTIPSIRGGSRGAGSLVRASWAFISEREREREGQV